MQRMTRTSVPLTVTEHAGLLRAQLDMSKAAGHRLTLREVVAELLRSWTARHEMGHEREQAG
jgi:hypothetical protein